MTPDAVSPVLLLLLSLAGPPAASEPAALPTVEAKTEGLTARDGLFRTWVDEAQGRIWLELPPPGGEGVVAEVLYVEGLVGGLGSNPVGLDRGQLGESPVVRVRRLGPRVLFEQVNLRYRALSDDPAERRAVAESFASSVLWGTGVAALDGDGRALVDLTPFLLLDAHGVVERLEATGQGTYKLEESRSAVDLAGCRAFPDNLVFEALVTFTASKPGREVRSAAADGRAFTLRQRIELVRLPAPGYRPRPHHPRGGAFAIDFQDYAAPLDQPIERRWIVRHRLEKVEPEAARSRVRQPIVYHVDRAAPEPVRSALLEGAGFWARAFEEAGFEDAFRVELLPEGADPLDVRYNVVEWVHRATRGWSYGGGLVDPRTGERIKGHVSLGSLRVRQDRLLFEALLGTAHTGSGRPDDPIELALARIRQLAAHEVGHALGLAHNFAASTQDRASVMDYPAPLVRVGEDGAVDCSRAYAVGVGPWDVQAIRYAYTGTSPESEAGTLRAIVADGDAKGLLFLTDEDARSPGSAHPAASLWDNGADPVAALVEALRVRAVALRGFGPDRVSGGQPLALLEERLAIVYLYHRYQLEAAAKLLGGVDYTYAVRGEEERPARPVAAARQREALRALVGLLDPAVLDLPESVLSWLLPRPFGYEPSREQFQGHAAPLFDPLAAAATASGAAVGALLDPDRATRLVDQHRRNPALPGLEEVLRALADRVLDRSELPERLAELRRVAGGTIVEELVRLAGDEGASPAVRTRVEAALGELRARLESGGSRGEPEERASERVLARRIGRFLGRREVDERGAGAAPPAPPGSPIGDPGRDGRDGARGCSTPPWR